MKLLTIVELAEIAKPIIQAARDDLGPDAGGSLRDLLADQFSERGLNISLYDIDCVLVTCGEITEIERRHYL